MNWLTRSRTGRTRRSNLLRRKLMPNPCCATPEARPVPALLEEPAWEYGTLHQGMPPPGFDLTAVELGLESIGFNLFEITRTIAVRPPIEVRRPEALAPCRPAGTARN